MLDELVDLVQEGFAAAAGLSADDDVRYLRQVAAVALHARHRRCW